MTKEIIDIQFELRASRTPYAVATVVEILGSSAAKPAAKALFDASGRMLCGWIGGGCAQSMVSESVLECLRTATTRMIEIDLDDEVFGAGMPCGGRMRVYVEPVLPKPVLWLMGHGRLVESLCAFAHGVGFDVMVNDTLASADRLPNACSIVTDDCRYEQLRPAPGDFVVIATHHKGDYDSLTRALQSDASYIALVSSRKRARLVLRRLEKEGLKRGDLARIHAPAGLDLGAQLPEEIALSIVAEMVLVRRGGSGRSLSENANALMASDDSMRT